MTKSFKEQEGTKGEPSTLNVTPIYLQDGVERSYVKCVWVIVINQKKKRKSYSFLFYRYHDIKNKYLMYLAPIDKVAYIYVNWVYLGWLGGMSGILSTHEFNFCK